MSQNQLIEINPFSVKVDPGFNVRIDYGNIEELANSIATNGLIRPIDVRKEADQLILVDGHRRMRALTLLKEQGRAMLEIPARVVRSEDVNNQIIHMIVSNEGKNLTPIEEASAFKRLSELGMSIQEIAKSVSKSVSHVTDRMSLLTADPELLKLISRKKMGVTAVVCAIKNSKGDKKVQRQIAETAKKDVEAATRMAYTKDGKPQGSKIWISKRHKKLMSDAFERAIQSHKQMNSEEFNYYLGYLKGIQEMADLSNEDMDALGFNVDQALFPETC